MSHMLLVLDGLKQNHFETMVSLESLFGENIQSFAQPKIGLNSIFFSL